MFSWKRDYEEYNVAGYWHMSTVRPTLYYRFRLQTGIFQWMELHKRQWISFIFSSKADDRPATLFILEAFKT